MNEKDLLVNIKTIIKIGKFVNLRSLESLDDVVLPESFDYVIYLANGVKVTQENVDEYRAKKTL